MIEDLAISAVWRKTVETTAARAFTLAVGVLGLILLTRLLGPEGQGTVAAAIAWATLAAAAAGLSLGQVSQYRTQARPALARDGAIFGSLLVLAITLSSIACILLVTAHRLTNGAFFGHLPSSVVAFAIVLTPLLIWDDYAAHLLTAADGIRTYNRIQVTGRSLGLVLLVVFVAALGGGVRAALAAYAVGQGFIAINSLIALHRLHRSSLRVVPAEIYEFMRGALHLHPNTVAAYFLSQSSVVVLNWLASRASVGWYHLAWQLIAIPMIVPQAASLTLYAKIAADGPDRAWPAHKRIMVGVMAFMLMLVAFAYAIGPQMIVYVVGNEFRPSAELFRILLPALLGMSFSQLMTPQWISRGIFLPTSVISLATAALHLVLTIALIETNGVNGAAWATSLTLATGPLLVQGYFVLWCERQYRRLLLTRQLGPIQHFTR